jgi:hypothetical protein
MKRDGPKVPTAVKGPSGITHHPNETSNAIADCLGNQFTSHDLCDENHERRVETVVHVLFASADDISLETLDPVFTETCKDEIEKGLWT